MKCMYFKIESSGFAGSNQAATFGGLISLLMKRETDESSNTASSESEGEGTQVPQPCTEVGDFCLCHSLWEIQEVLQQQDAVLACPEAAA